MADPGLLSHLGRLNQASHRPDTPRLRLRCSPSSQDGRLHPAHANIRPKVDYKLGGRESEAGGCQPRWIKIGQPATQTASANS